MIKAKDVAELVAQLLAAEGFGQSANPGLRSRDARHERPVTLVGGYVAVLTPAQLNEWQIHLDSLPEYQLYCELEWKVEHLAFCLSSGTMSVAADYREAEWLFLRRQWLGAEQKLFVIAREWVEATYAKGDAGA